MEQGRGSSVNKQSKRPWGHAAMERRIKALEGRMSEVEATLTKAVADVETTTANTQAILDILTGAKTWVGYVRKYGPHLATLIIGALVSAGYISAETGRGFSVLFGL